MKLQVLIPLITFVCEAWHQVRPRLLEVMDAIAEVFVNTAIAAGVL